MSSPNTPTLSVGAITSSSIALSWNDVATGGQAVNYKVYQSSLPSVHAENAVLRKLYKLHKRRKFKKNQSFDIVCVRTTTTAFGYSRPCHDCIIHMTKSEYTIRNVYYTDKQGELCVEKLSNMFDSPLTQCTYGTRRCK